MALDPKVAKALNAQVNNELEAAHAYLATAAYFEADGLPGFATWFRGHAEEENEHAMRIFDYINKRGGQVKIEAIPAPKANYNNAESAVKAGYEHEQTVTGQIEDLFALAAKVNDYRTQAMLQWFLTEQDEEEDLFRRTLDLVQATDGNRWNLMQLDGQIKRPEGG